MNSWVVESTAGFAGRIFAVGSYLYVPISTASYTREELHRKLVLNVVQWQDPSDLWRAMTRYSKSTTVDRFGRTEVISTRNVSKRGMANWLRNDHREKRKTSYIKSNLPLEASLVGTLLWYIGTQTMTKLGFLLSFSFLPLFLILSSRPDSFEWILPLAAPFPS